ncbi:MAG: DUF5131 family protein [Desulfobaccales bacterium]
MILSPILGDRRNGKGLFWTDPLSLVSGCTPCSPGCLHCWLADMAHRFPESHPKDIVDAKGKWTGKIVLHPERLEILLRAKKPRVFAVWSDLFHEDVPESFIDLFLDHVSACPQHIILLVTKRPQNIEQKVYGVTPESPCRALGGGDYLQNLWYLVTVESQAQTDYRLLLVQQIPASKLGILYEPALGPVDFVNGAHNYLSSWNEYGPVAKYQGYDFIIAGPETGRGRRRADINWFRSARSQAQAAGLPYFQKALQVGGRISKKMDEWPEDMRVRELP